MAEEQAIHQLGFCSLTKTKATALPHFPDAYILNETLRDQAHIAVLSVAERMRQPEQIYASAQLAHKQSARPQGWFAPGVSQGFAGVTLFYTYLDRCFPHEGWDRVAYQYMKLTAEGTRQVAVNKPALFFGTSGIAMALHLLHTTHPFYQQVLIKLNHDLCLQTLQQVEGLYQKEHLTMHDYDIISGVSGILLYLITLEEPDEEILQVIESILAFLTWLAEPGQVLGKERWFLAPDVLPKDDILLYPQGNFNCGLAHGIPGPLAALSLTWLAGYRYASLRDAIAFASYWLVQHHLTDRWGINWPNVVPLQQAHQPQDWQSLQGSRTGWCYGAPGVARSLWLAGLALNDDHLCKFSLEAMEAVLRHSSQERLIYSPTLCHGIAGLLQICVRFACESKCANIAQHIPLLLSQILELFSSDHLLGFRDEESPGVYVDQAGWLTGAPGTAMAILAATTTEVPRWDRLLALA